MSNSFEGKVALVTGGGSGIGKATAKLLASRGASVVVVDLAEENGRAVVDEIVGANGKAAFIRTDVTDEQQVQAMVQFAVDTFGGLDLAHNNAGISQQPTLLHETSVDLWDKVISVNLRSVFLCLKAEITYMLDNGGGAIVNTSSMAAELGSEGGDAYTTSKHAVNGLTKNAAIDYAKRGIRINAVAPGVIETPIMAALDPAQVKAYGDSMLMGRLGQPEEIAEAVAFLLSDGASYINGATISVDGGSTKVM